MGIVGRLNYSGSKSPFTFSREVMNKSSPFLRFARIIKLGNIAGEDFVPYLETSLDEASIAEPGKLARDIFDFTGGHPYYTQLLAQQALLLQSKLKPGPGRISQLLKETLYVEKDYLERLWENISENRQQKVVMLAPYRPLTKILDQKNHPEN